jgi:hypothetical protein
MRNSLRYVALNVLMISELKTVWQAVARVLTEVTPLPLPGSRPPEYPVGTEECGAVRIIKCTAKTIGCYFRRYSE